VLRVGFLIDSFEVGGTELNAIKVAESLVKHSVTLTVFHFQVSGPLRKRYENLGVQLVHVPLRGLASLSALRAIKKIHNIAYSEAVQLLHTHCVYSNVIGAGVRTLGFPRVPLLVSRRWSGYADRTGLHRLNAIAQSVADAVLVNAPSLASMVSRESPSAKVSYVPNILPEANFRPTSREERASSRLAFGLSPTATIVGYVARLAPVKDHATLLHAWKIVEARVPGLQLAVIGQGTLLPELQMLAERIGVSASVRFTGTIPAEALPHSLLDVSVLTSTDEGFPNSVLEAMAQGVPVIATNVGGVSDLVTDGRNGILVDAGSPVAAAIEDIVVGRAAVSDLIAGGNYTALQHGESRVLEKLLRVYRQIVLHP
jgi:glycosyltransferase involved in cell wall biosynthesis